MAISRISSNSVNFNYPVYKKDVENINNVTFDTIYSGFGYTKQLEKSERFTELTTSNTLVDNGGDSIRFTKGLVDRLPSELISFYEAPFSGADDELLESTIETQQNHKAGDIIHCGDGDELVQIDNYTYHGDNTPVYDSETGELTVTNNGDEYGYVSYVVTASAGDFLIVSFDLVSTTASPVKVRFDENSGDYTDGDLYDEIISTGQQTHIVRPIDSESRLTFIMDNDSDANMVIKNLSVRTSSDTTYQATTQTIAGDLVTDITKFTKINFVSRQDVIFVGEDGKYKTIKGYRNFDAGFSVDDVADAYGWTKVGKGLFTVSNLECKDTDGTILNYTGEIAGISLVSRLNAKMYDVAHNPFGTRKNSDDKFWYEVENANTYETLNADTSTTSGRPYGRLEDKIYFEGLGGLVFRNTLAIKPNKKDLLEDETNKLVDVDEMSEECGVVTTMLPLVPYKTQLDYLDDGIIVKHNQLLQQGKALTLDIIGNPAKYVIGDSTTELHSDSTDSGTLLRQGALCWNVSENKMYVYLDTDNRDNVDMTAEDFSDTAKYKYVVGRYPNSWYDRLDSGLSLPFNALLVGQDGTSYIPDNTLKYRISSKKHKENFSLYLSSDNNLFNWVDSGTLKSRFNAVSNSTYSTDIPNRLYVASYVSLPSPTSQTDHKQVLMVSDKVLASNSHSWYQGGGIVNAVTGKVSVGNGSNGFEGKSLKINNTFKVDCIASKTGAFDGDNGSLIYVDLSNVNSDFTGNIYQRIAGEFFDLDAKNYASFGNTVYWVKLGKFSNPSHSTLNIDNSSSQASKAFTTLCIDNNSELLIGLYGEELINDYDGNNTNITFDADADEDITVIRGENYEFFFENEADSKDGALYKFAGMILKYIGNGQTFNRSDADNMVITYEDGITGGPLGVTFTSDGRLVNENTGAECVDWQIWSGNGFGDNGKFSQLTNGTKLDLNGNTVRTYFGIKRTGFYV